MRLTSFCGPGLFAGQPAGLGLRTAASLLSPLPRRLWAEPLCTRPSSPRPTSPPAVPAERYEVDPELAKALEIIFILHLDHEQNASTSTVRTAGSSQANPFACVASGIAALWGPAHGGANEAVLKMLEEIQTLGGLDAIPAVSGESLGSGVGVAIPTVSEGLACPCLRPWLWCGCLCWRKPRQLPATMAPAASLVLPWQGCHHRPSCTDPALSMPPPLRGSQTPATPAPSLAPRR